MARIMFVDDDPFTLEMLNKSVQIFGHEAILANTGEQALALSQSESPDLILTDMCLPDMDGLMLLKNLRQAPATKEVAVVILSASPELDVVELTQSAGAKEYLLKPVRLQTLQEVIERYT
jgi:CheY-like chemotaxis protein